MAFQSSAQKRGFQGVTKLRKTLRRLEPEASEELQNVVLEAGEMLQFLILGSAPVMSGDLRDHVGYKLSRDKLTVLAGVGANSASIQKIGFGESKTRYTKAGNESSASLRDKADRWALYKALWAEFGTKGSPAHGIPAQPATHFHQKAFDQASPRIRAQATSAISKALKKASSGGGGAPAPRPGSI